VKSPDAAPRGCDQEVERSVTVDISETHSVETKRVAWNSAVVGLEQRVDDASSCPAATDPTHLLLFSFRRGTATGSLFRTRRPHHVKVTPQIVQAQVEHALVV